MLLGISNLEKRDSSLTEVVSWYTAERLSTASTTKRKHFHLIDIFTVIVVFVCFSISQKYFTPRCRKFHFQQIKGKCHNCLFVSFGKHSDRTLFR